MSVRNRICAVLVLGVLALIGCGGGGGNAAPGNSNGNPPATQPGLFSATGSLSTPRTSHTAILLPNGKVLIAGGGGATGAEIYDPTTAHFGSTGAMAYPDRESPAAVALSDGKVLISGGLRTSEFPLTSLTSTEIFDPATSRFSNTGPLRTGTYGHCLVLLANGTVLLVGSDAEVYSPSVGTWGTTVNFGQSRDYATATRLPNGKVLVCGGELGGGSATNTALLFDPATNQFAPTGSMSVARQDHTATLLANGKVLIAGGRTDSMDTAVHATCELYDPSTGTFTATGSLLTRRTGHSSTLLGSGKVLLAGGYSGGGASGYLASAEIYDPATGHVSSTGAMAKSRDSHTATLLSDGKVLVVGGADSNSSTATAEIYW